MTCKEILEILVSKMFFENSVDFSGEPCKKPRKLLSFLTYFQINIKNNKAGTIKWFLEQKCDDSEPAFVKQILKDAQDILRKANHPRVCGFQNRKLIFSSKISPLIEYIIDFWNLISETGKTHWPDISNNQLIQNTITSWDRESKGKVYGDFYKEVTDQIAEKKAHREHKEWYAMYGKYAWESADLPGTELIHEQPWPNL